MAAVTADCGVESGEFGGFSVHQSGKMASGANNLLTGEIREVYKFNRRRGNDTICGLARRCTAGTPDRLA